MQVHWGDFTHKSHSVNRLCTVSPLSVAVSPLSVAVSPLSVARNGGEWAVSPLSVARNGGEWAGERGRREPPPFPGCYNVGRSSRSTQVLYEEEEDERSGGKETGIKIKIRIEVRNRPGKDGGQALHSRLASRARTALRWMRSHACRLFTAMPVPAVLSQVDVMDDANWRSRTQAATPRVPLGPDVR